MYDKTICIASILDERLTKNVYSLVTKAKKLSQNGKYKILAVIFGKLIEDEKEKLFQCGADKVICCKGKSGKLLKYDEILYDILKREYVSLLLFPAYDKEKECAARLAISISAGLTAECIDIDNYQESDFIFTRAAMSDTVTANIICVNTSISMCTVKHNVFSEQFEFLSRGEYEKLDCTDDKYYETQIEIMKRVKRQIMKNSSLENAKIAFGIGRGVKDKRTLEIIHNIAHKAGGIVVGTRAVVEENVLGKEWQVGQSGSSINPDLYVAIGISGAIQHMVGVTGAKKIIAINKNENAPIFHYADYSIIGNCNEIMMEIERKWKM